MADTCASASTEPSAGAAFSVSTATRPPPPGAGAKGLGELSAGDGHGVVSWYDGVKLKKLERGFSRPLVIWQMATHFLRRSKRALHKPAPPWNWLCQATGGVPQGGDCAKRLRGASHLGAMRSAPSRRMTSPLRWP